MKTGFLKLLNRQNNNRFANGLVLHVFTYPKLNSVPSWTCTKMFLLYALFILFPKLETLALPFSHIHPVKQLLEILHQIYSLFCPHETAYQFANITGSLYNFVFLYMLLLARIFLLSIWPMTTSLLFQILSQMFSWIVGNTVFYAPTAILSLLWYSAFIIPYACEILQNRKHNLNIFVSHPGCGRYTIQGTYLINLEWMNVRRHTNKQMNE